MSAPTSTNVDPLASQLKPSLEARIRLRDLPTPAEVQPFVEEHCRGFWFWERREAQRQVEEDLKLQYYFGGHCVYFLDTPEGISIIQLDIVQEGGYRRLRDQLSEEEREQLRFLPVEKWNAEPHLPSIYYLG